ncbi:hypothetical protein [Aureivirga sp. CE67]|uniref:hypothetical protein n=1 Tax=Aureivirga sp. CE67 TaxID=1788983 RepID=UPI0018CB31EE|nr:hypothetical protein [Aureivirga sp. CE67]
MNFKNLKGAAILLSLFIAASCSKDEEVTRAAEFETVEVQNSTEQRKSSLNELGYSSVEEMIQDGWEIIYESPEDSVSTNRNQRERFTYNQNSEAARVPFTIQHLRELGYRPDTKYGLNAIKDIFTHEYTGKKPDAIYFSEKEYLGEVKFPNVTDFLEVKTDVVVGEPEVTVKAIEAPLPADVTTFELVNEGAEEAKMSSTYTYTRGHVSNWSVTASGSLTVGANVSVGIQGMTTIGANVGVTVGASGTKGGNKSELTSVSEQVSAVVPPRSKRTVTIIADRKKSEVTYKVPMKVKGVVGLSKNHKYEDDYIWGQDASKIQNGEIAEKGVAGLVLHLGVKAVVSPAQPL